VGAVVVAGNTAQVGNLDQNKLFVTKNKQTNLEVAALPVVLDEVGLVHDGRGRVDQVGPAALQQLAEISKRAISNKERPGS
jgi:hypothetical protein